MQLLPLRCSEQPATSNLTMGSIVSLAWFTYDTELPAEDATANLGDPGHRWLTAVGPIEGNQAIMEIEMTSVGLFDTATLIDRTDPPG